MKNTIFLLILNFLLWPCIAFAPPPDPGEPTPASSANNVNWVKKATQQHSPDSWNLLVLYDRLPQKQESKMTDGSTLSTQKPVTTFHYLNGKDRKDLLIAMSTNVHEISHAYFRNNSLKYANDNGIRLNWAHVEGTFYLTPTQALFISVPREILFPSKKLAAVIPSGLKSFRYETYIRGNTSTQNEGVVGLLNEFHAYYLGSRFTYEMFDAYSASEGSAKGFHYWISHIQSIMSAYFEFDYFIREYLLLMKEQYPKDYELLKSNKSFREAYTRVHALYGNLVKNYEEKVKKHTKQLNDSKEADVSMEEEILWVAPSGSKFRMGTSVFSEDKNKLEAQLKTDRYQAIEKDFFGNRD